MTVRKEDRPGLTERRRCHLAVVARLARRQRKSALRVMDRVLQQGAQRHRAVTLERRPPGIDQAGDRGGQPAGLGDPSVGQITVDGRGERCGAAAIDRGHGLSLRRRDQQEGIATELSTPGLHHREDRPGGDGGVERVPPGSQHPQPGRAGQWIDARDHSVRGSTRFLGRPAIGHGCRGMSGTFNAHSSSRARWRTRHRARDRQ